MTSARELLDRDSNLATAATIVAAILLAALVMVGVPGSSALFTDDYPKAVTISASRIFRGERTTPAFSVSDVSSGTAVDRSSGTAYPSDGLYFVSQPWPAAFDADRWIELDLNRPLPGGLAVSNGNIHVRLVSDAGAGTLCMYGDIRRASTGTVIVSGGSPSSPLACTTGSSPIVLNIALGVTIDTTDLANDLRVRIYARDSAAGAMRVDQVTIVADTPYNTFTLYPLLTRESFSGQTQTVPWGLAAQ